MAKITMKDPHPHGFKQDCKKLRCAHFVADSKYKEKCYAEDEAYLDEKAVMEYEERWKAYKIEKPEKKKIAKENEKLVKEGNPTQDKDWVRSRLEKERGAGKAAIQRNKLPRKLVKAIDGLEKIKSFKL